MVRNLAPIPLKHLPIQSTQLPVNTLLCLTLPLSPALGHPSPLNRRSEPGSRFPPLLCRCLSCLAISPAPPHPSRAAPRLLFLPCSDSTTSYKPWWVIFHTVWLIKQVWPCSTKGSRAKANRVLPRDHPGHSKHSLPTTQETTQHVDSTRWSIPKSDWLYSLQLKMEKLYRVSKNKTRKWLWLSSWTPDCKIQTWRE